MTYKKCPMPNNNYMEGITNMTHREHWLAPQHSMFSRLNADCSAACDNLLSYSSLLTVLTRHGNVLLLSWLQTQHNTNSATLNIIPRCRSRRATSINLADGFWHQLGGLNRLVDLLMTWKILNRLYRPARLLLANLCSLPQQRLTWLDCWLSALSTWLIWLGHLMTALVDQLSWL